jgi:hypothetical protein
MQSSILGSFDYDFGVIYEKLHGVLTSEQEMLIITLDKVSQTIAPQQG